MTMTSSERMMMNIDLSQEEILADYRLAFMSRQASLIGRREVMSGKAKFGIFGDGKEVPQIALAKVFKPGDFRSGYYRDQTLMFALGLLSFREFFAQLYAHSDEKFDPSSAGRQMNSHFSTRLISKQNGTWEHLSGLINSSADLSPTGSQMPRLVGLGYASVLFRKLPELSQFANLSNSGNEIAFGTIGNASCAEGLFWESINAIGVLQAPVILSIWDDGYGISVPNEFQILNKNIAGLLDGFQRSSQEQPGFDVYSVAGWRYDELISIYRSAEINARKSHTPSIVHVHELTQPQGHSTSGSHQRYKPKERLNWENEFDCLRQMRFWILSNELCSEAEIDEIEESAKMLVEQERAAAWAAYQKVVHGEIKKFFQLIEQIPMTGNAVKEVHRIQNSLKNVYLPSRADVLASAQQALISLRNQTGEEIEKLIQWRQKKTKEISNVYGKHLVNESSSSALKVPEIPAKYSDESSFIQGYQIMNACFDNMLSRYPNIVAFGEDVGRIGDVNQGFAGLQRKYGKLRVSDTGIRETTIIGQAIGLAMRGLRPIAEIQYLDYLLYALQIISDDLATLHWRTFGAQIAPVIIRTRGHRLEGIWHSGSPMAAIIHLVRGVHVLVPRNMTQAAGFYNTLLRSNDPGLIVEVLNGYRKKERLPINIGEFTIPIGVPEFLRYGDDITLVTYGANCQIALEASERLERVGIGVEVIDVRSLLPFDIHGLIGESVKKQTDWCF